MLEVRKNCTRCGRCVEVCPIYVLSMGEKGPIWDSTECIRCAHCEAVCPQNALIHPLIPHESDVFIRDWPGLDANQAELFLRSRRSIRCFRDEEVPKKEAERLIRMGRYAPTGSNIQEVSYIVVTGKTLQTLREQTIAFFGESDNPRWQILHAAFLKPGRDRLFRSAPMIVIAVCGADNENTVRNGQFALTYIELYAPVVGLGTCWTGNLERYLWSDAPQMRSLLEIPQGLKTSAALLVGYPKYRYNKLVDRDPAKIFWR